jgi:hypothetical protein
LRLSHPITSTDLPHVPAHYRPWLVAWEMGWPVAKIAEAWSTWENPLTPEMVQSVLDNISVDPPPARRASPPPPELTCARFREVAKAHGWTLEWLVSQVGRSLDEPTRTLQRLLQDNDPETVIPYTCLIELVREASLPPPASEGEPVCKCGCRGAVVGRQSYATPYYRLKTFRRKLRRGSNLQVGSR